MKKRIIFWISATLGFFLFPCIIAGIFAGKDGVKVKQKIDVERNLPWILYQQIDSECQEETLKAQAVLARSTMYYQIRESCYKPEKKQNLNLDVYKKAVQETRGQVLFAGGNICPGAYHWCSAGATRSGQEIFQDAEHAWMESVESGWDLKAEDYMTTVVISKKEMAEKMKISTDQKNLNEENIMDNIKTGEKDSQEYIIDMKVGKQYISGEEFCKIINLPSSCFVMQEVDNQIQFLCRGKGHGFGMSQYGADMQAKEGKTYMEILKYYFPECEIKNSDFLP